MANRAPNRRGAETRSKLLAAGLSEFHARGFNATGVDVIAKTAEVPKGSFYNLFESKEAFAAEIIDLYFERHRSKIAEFFDKAELPPLDRLRGYFHERIGFFVRLGFKKGCMMGNLSLETADHSERMRQRLAENFSIWSGLLAATIAEAQRRGDIKSKTDPEILADFILNSWEGALLRMKAAQSVKPLEEATKIIFETILV
ncbi:TetR/AcrR family transcriptional regulator [Roseixanthobacter pseudopolyaromaticivorans]|uniref:TetR/AcrR family transcriptional regulator n=1 Tax=Xanthobacteraceae TaxID=335928 RepID=UPI00372C5145